MPVRQKSSHNTRAQSGLDRRRLPYLRLIARVITLNQFEVLVKNKGCSGSKVDRTFLRYRSIDGLYISVIRLRSSALGALQVSNVFNNEPTYFFWHHRHAILSIPLHLKRVMTGNHPIDPACRALFDYIGEGFMKTIKHLLFIVLGVGWANQCSGSGKRQGLG
jgi:hypothetical protein